MRSPYDMNAGIFPFNKSVKSVTAEDILDLRQDEVKESWNIDFKLVMTDTKKIAKQISAFANSIGGYLIIGIAEKKGKDAVFGDIIGLTPEKVEAHERSFREAAAQISPPVDYEIHSVKGKLLEIDNNAVLVVYIPESNNVPHIHPDGMIYKRFHDQSKPETDRLIIDKMYEKREKKQINLATFLEIAFETKVRNPVLTVIYIPEESNSKFLSFDEFNECINDKKNRFFHLDFESIQPTQNGYVARHIGGNSIKGQHCKIRWWHNQKFKIEIPLEVSDFRSLVDIENPTEESSKLVTTLYNLDQAYLEQSYIVLSKLSAILLACSATFSNLCKASDISTKSKFYFSLKNCDGMSPFIHNADFYNKVESFHMPVIDDYEILEPSINDLDFAMTIFDSNKERTTDEKGIVATGVSILIHYLYVAMGVSREIDESLKYLSNFDEVSKK